VKSTQLLFLASLALASCRCNPSLASAHSAVTVAPASLDFGNVYLHANPQRSVTAQNSGDAPDTVTFTLLADGGSAFELEGGVFTLAGGAQVQLPITFAPAQAGAATATLQVSWSEGSTTVALTGNALPWPECGTAGPCATAGFDPVSGTCTQQPVADGTTCDGGDICLVETRCVSGQCLGQLDTCGGNDACTLNYCVPGVGCQSQATTQCQGTDPCQVYSCDPQSGCQSTAAPNGTPCDTAHDSCQTAGACIQGACVGIPVPDGTPCALWWAPCVGDATCTKGACGSPTANALQPGQELWRWSDAGYMIGGGATSLAVDDLGNSYLPYLADPYGTSAAWIALDSCGRTLWNVPWGGAVDPNDRGYSASLSGGELILWANDQVVGVAPATGTQLWQTDLLQMARQADGDDGGFLEVGFESISSQGTMFFEAWHCCNVNQYALLALGQTGAPLWSQPLPFDTYEVLSDTAGNAYVDINGFYVDGGAWTGLQSFDDLGRQRFMVATSGSEASPAAVGANDVLVLNYTYSQQWEASVVDVTALALGGNALYGPVTAGPILFGVSGTVIDASGTTYLVGFQPSPDGGQWSSNGTVVAMAASGSVSWTSTLPQGQFPISMPALGDGNTLFLVTAAGPDYFTLEDWLVGLDTSTGKLLWQQDLGPDPSPTHDGGDPAASLALASTGELLVSDGYGVTAYFAGQHQPPANAPWPRGVGGDNTNRWSPASSGP
jgi:hypothetical protein